MKIKDGFITRDIAGVNIVIPSGKRVVDFNGMLTLNETGIFLWKALADGGNAEQLAVMLSEEFEVAIEEARKDVNEFLQELIAGEVLEDYRF